MVGSSRANRPEILINRIDSFGTVGSPELTSCIGLGYRFPRNAQALMMGAKQLFPNTYSAAWGKGLKRLPEAPPIHDVRINRLELEW